MRRSVTLISGALVALLVLAGCSDVPSNDDASARDAASTELAAGAIPGANDDPLDLEKFCGANEARNNTSEINGYMVASCFIFDNRTAVFTAPGVVSSEVADRIPLTVPRFSGNGTGSSSLLGGYQPGGASGVISGERVGSGATQVCGRTLTPQDPYACAGRLTPNPFRGTAAMAIEQIQVWEGTVNRLDLNGVVAPFSTSQRSAQAWMNNTWAGEPTAGCINGAYLSCTLDSGFDPKVHGGHQRPRFSLTTRPLRVLVQNAMTSTKRFSLRPLIDPDGQNLLAEPRANTTLPVVDGVVRGVPAGSTLDYGGYRTIDGVTVWQGLFELVDSNGGYACTGCGTVITITVKVDPKPPAEGKKPDPYAGSSCVVTAMGNVSIACDTPYFSGSIGGVLDATINIRDF